MTQQEAIQRRKQISNLMSRMAQRDALTPEDKLEFDKLEREFRDLATLAADSSRASTRPPNGNIEGQRDGQSHDERWIDEGTGREVRVLRPDQSVRESRDSLGYDLGDFLRCCVRGGTKNPELRAAMGEGSGAAGQYFVPTPLSAELIDRLRAKSVLIRAGMRTVPMTAETLYMARVGSDPVVVQHAENTADLDNNISPTIERIGFTAHALGVIVRCSRELVEDTGVGGGLGDVLTSIFAKAMAVEIDSECLFNVGSSNTITGLKYYPSVPTTAFNGTPADYTVILNGIGALLSRNADFPTAAIMATRSYMQLAGLQNSLHDAMRKPDILDNFPLLETSKIPVNDGVGSPATFNGSAVYIGDFTQAMLGVRTDLRVTTLNERYAEAGQIAFSAWWRGDFQLRHPESFDIQTGLQP
jgi:HK97 family phage major capsid protein